MAERTRLLSSTMNAGSSASSLRPTCYPRSRGSWRASHGTDENCAADRQTPCELQMPPARRGDGERQRTWQHLSLCCLKLMFRSPPGLATRFPLQPKLAAGCFGGLRHRLSGTSTVDPDPGTVAVVKGGVRPWRRWPALVSIVLRSPGSVALGEKHKPCGEVI